jgi:hypothetical protein
VDAQLSAKAATRSLMAATFGLVGDLPSVVTTGCGKEAPYAMTSPHPESVTCLPCRDHAHTQHLRLADQVERLGDTPGSPVDRRHVAAVAEHHRDLARRFSGPQG